MLCAPNAWSASPGLDFSVRHVDTRNEGETWLLDAGIVLEFNHESRQAMESGVPLTVLLEVEVVRERLSGTKASVESACLPYPEARAERALRRYLRPSGKSRTYGAIEDASMMLGTIRD